MNHLQINESCGKITRKQTEKLHLSHQLKFRYRKWRYYTLILLVCNYVLIHIGQLEIIRVLHLRKIAMKCNEVNKLHRYRLHTAGSQSESFCSVGFVFLLLFHCTGIWDVSHIRPTYTVNVPAARLHDEKVYKIKAQVFTGN